MLVCAELRCAVLCMAGATRPDEVRLVLCSAAASISLKGDTALHRSLLLTQPAPHLPCSALPSPGCPPAFCLACRW